MSVQQVEQIVNGPSVATKLGRGSGQLFGKLKAGLSAIVGHIKPYANMGVLGVLCFPAAAAMITPIAGLAVLGAALLVIERAVKG